MTPSHPGVDTAEITPEANIRGDLGADSLDIVEMSRALQELFDSEIPDGDAEPMRTVGDVERYVRGRVA